MRTSAGFDAVRPLDGYQTIQILLRNIDRRIAALFKKNNSFSGLLLSNYVPAILNFRWEITPKFGYLVVNTTRIAHLLERLPNGPLICNERADWFIC